jgi:CDP-diacylglycerol--glycerol-3-phosphate 3-phosphatidyltransferase
MTAMNAANKLTIARVIIVPIFLLFLLIPSKYGMLVSAIIFLAASATDSLDGHIARKYNQVTDFGKFLDPLADKLLVISALVGLVELGALPAWITIVIIARELMVTSIRLVAASSNGTVIAASIWGKLKTVSQIVAVLIMLIQLQFTPQDTTIGMIFMGIAVLLTVYSGINYLMANWKFISQMGGK